jgi:hypothetical protein
LLFHSAPAHAEDAEMRTAARELATQGGQAFDAGHYEKAADFFLRAYELVHAPSIGLMRARSLAKLGQLVEAIDVYEQTFRTKLTAGAPEAYVKAVAAARSEVEDVRRRVPRVKITLANASASEATEVTIDDKPSPVALLGVERPMNPGAHHVALVVSGHTRASRDFALEEGQSLSLELDATPPPVSPAEPAKPAEIKPDSAPAVAAQVAPNPKKSTTTSSSTTRVLGYVGVGVGAVGLGLGTYTGLVALHHKSELDSVCHPGCPESSAGDLSGFRSNRTISWLSYGVGIAAAGAGVVLLTLGDSKREQVSLRVWPGGLQIGGKL